MIQMNWSSGKPPPPGMLEVLRKDPIPVWAAAPPMTAKLTTLRQAYSAFTQVESSVLQIIAQLSSGDNTPSMGDVSGTLKDLLEQEWPTKLATAGEQLKVVCRTAAILPFPLLKLVTTQVGNTG